MSANKPLFMTVLWVVAMLSSFTAATHGIKPGDVPHPYFDYSEYVGYIIVFYGLEIF